MVGNREGGCPLGRIVLIEVSFPTRWDTTLITLCLSHHHWGDGLIRERRKTLLRDRKRDRQREQDISRERENTNGEKHTKHECDMENKRLGADFQREKGSERKKTYTAWVTMRKSFPKVELTFSSYSLNLSTWGSKRCRCKWTRPLLSWKTKQEQSGT